MGFGETTLTLRETLWLLSPELVLLVTGLFLLLFDMMVRPQEEKSWLPYVVVVGLIAALIATITLWGCEETRVLTVLSCDGFALAVKMIAYVAMILVVLVSDAYIQRQGSYQGVFYMLLLICTMAISLMAGAVDLVLIYLAFETISITSYLLTGYLRYDRRSAEGGIKYLLYGAGISAVMLYGMSWLYGITGTTDLVGISQGLMVAEESMRVLLFVVMVLLSAGFAFKIGAVPFHQWAPDAYEGAPTPAAAFISVAPKIGGFALILRVMLTMVPRTEFWNIAGDLWVSIAVLTMTIGNLVALWQSNVKRLLAYSSIAQAGYILIGVVALSPRGVAAVLLYLLAYALTNLGAFAAVVAFSNQTGSDEIEDYAGLHKRAPGMALVMLVCLLSLAGIPPTAGFFGKLYLFSAAIEHPNGILTLLAVIGVINSVISLAYYWKVIRAMYFLSSDEEERLPVSLSLNVALGVALAGVLLLTVFLSPLFNLLEVAARTFFG